MNLHPNSSIGERLTCYHGILFSIKPVVENRDMVDSFFFSQYGPEEYSPEDISRYVRRSRVLDTPGGPREKVSYIRLRVCPYSERIDSFNELLAQSLDQNSALVLDYEILKHYDPVADLGNRYGRRNDGTIDYDSTISFVRYWEAGCRYILSGLNQTSGFRQNIDVWGIPHLINNAIGSWLRLSPNAQKCPSCGKSLWIATIPCQLSQALAAKDLPLFPAFCLDCGWAGPFHTNT